MEESTLVSKVYLSLLIKIRVYCLHKNSVDEFIVSYCVVQKQNNEYNCGIFQTGFAGETTAGSSLSVQESARINIVFHHF